MTFFFVLCFGNTVTYTDIGVIEQHIQDQDQTPDDSSYQENVLRRRLLPGGLTDADKLIVLNTQNQYRSLTAQGSTPNQPSATGMNQLLWDEGLAKVAQNYSSKCIWGHNPNRASQLKGYLNSATFDYVNQYLGENLFISTGPETIDTVLAGIAYWYNEHQYYTYGPVEGAGTCQSGQQCGHYTQLVWAKTRYVGCGYTKCPTVQNLPTFTNAILFACDYYFAGNYVDDYPYETGDGCSQCPGDRNTCQDGLCTGCPSRSWDTYCCEYCSSSRCSNAINSGLCNSQTSCSNGITSTVSSATADPTTSKPTTAKPTTAKPTTVNPTTAKPTTANPTTAKPTTAKPTITNSPTARPTATSTTLSPTSKPTIKPTAKPTIKPTTKPTIKPTTKPTQNKGCCLAFSSSDVSTCEVLDSSSCQSNQKCFWYANC